MTPSTARSLYFGHLNIHNRKVERALRLIGKDAEVLHKFHVEKDRTDRAGEARAVEKLVTALELLPRKDSCSSIASSAVPETST